MKRNMIISLAAALTGLLFAPMGATAACEVYHYVRTKVERSSAFQTLRVTYHERSTLYTKEEDRKRYQLAYNKLGPVVVQYAHNLLVQAAKDPKSKIILPRGEGTLTYEAILTLLNRFKGKDGPYGDFDPARVILLDISQELVKEARGGDKWGGRNPDVLMKRMLEEKGIRGNDKLIWAGVWDNGQKGAEFSYLKDISALAGVTATDQRLMLVSPGNLSDGVGSICLECGGNPTWNKMFQTPEGRNLVAYHLFTLTGRSQGDKIPFQLKIDPKTDKVVAVTAETKDKPSEVVKPYSPYGASIPDAADPTYDAKLKRAMYQGPRELGVADVVRSVSLDDLREGEREPGKSAANNPAVRRLTIHYVNFLSLLVPTKTGLSKIDPEAPTDLVPAVALRP